MVVPPVIPWECLFIRAAQLRARPADAGRDKRRARNRRARAARRMQQRRQR